GGVLPGQLRGAPLLRARPLHRAPPREPAVDAVEPPHEAVPPLAPLQARAALVRRHLAPLRPRVRLRRGPLPGAPQRHRAHPGPHRRTARMDATLRRATRQRTVYPFHRLVGAARGAPARPKTLVSAGPSAPAPSPGFPLEPAPVCRRNPHQTWVWARLRSPSEAWGLLQPARGRPVGARSNPPPAQPGA